MAHTLIGPLLFASANRGKFKEVSAIAGSIGIELISPAEVLNKGAHPEVDENAESYEGNCFLKAAAFNRWSGLPSLADDTGLEVAALNGRPGVHSARYAGPGAAMMENIDKLLAELKSVEEKLGCPIDRRARFVCHLILVRLDGSTLHTAGELNGRIGFETKGSGGFGYDSVFIVDGYDRTLAELKEEGVPVKTHRIRALEQMAGLLRSPLFTAADRS